MSVDDMPGQVKIRHGDVFNEPADVAVLPCATDGKLKDFARRTREDMALPEPPHDLALGELKLYRVTLSDQPVRYLAYVAARDNTGSSIAVLAKLGAALGELTRSDGIAVLAAPLLGTGAGRVSVIPAIQALVDGFRSTATEASTLSLCAPRQKTFKILKDWFSAWCIKLRKSPRVFLSYNQSTQANWIAALHEFLKGQGVDAVVDRWALKLTMDLNSWMTDEISRAEKVIIVTDEVYARKADAREGGVGEETVIIETDMQTQKSIGKYIVIVRSATPKTATPIYLQGRLIVPCPSDDATPSVYQDILKALYDEEQVAPASGIPPIYF